MVFLPEAWIAVANGQHCVPKTFIFDTSRFIRESQRFFRVSAKSGPNFYDAESLLLFRFATCALATLSMKHGSARIFTGGIPPCKKLPA
jgi:hypothetical protein